MPKYSHDYYMRHWDNMKQNTQRIRKIIIKRIEGVKNG